MYPEVDLIEAISALINAQTPEEWGHIVEQRRTVFLTSPSPGLQVLQGVLDEEIRQKRNKELALQLNARLRFLEIAIKENIPEAVRQATILAKQKEAIEAYLGAGVLQAPAVLLHYQAALLSDEGFADAKRIAEGIEKTSDPSERDFQGRNIVRRLKIQALAQARAYDVDYAVNWYQQQVAELIRSNQLR
jgi:hypothetical protein